MTFQEEFLALLKKHGIAYDERYLWERKSAVPAGLALDGHRVPNVETLGYCHFSLREQERRSTVPTEKGAPATMAQSQRAPPSRGSRLILSPRLQQRGRAALEVVQGLSPPCICPRGTCRQ